MQRMPTSKHREAKYGSALSRIALRRNQIRAPLDGALRDEVHLAADDTRQFLVPRRFTALLQLAGGLGIFDAWKGQVELATSSRNCCQDAR
jgi:hypothetical protein